MGKVSSSVFCVFVKKQVQVEEIEQQVEKFVSRSFFSIGEIILDTCSWMTPVKPMQ